MNRLSNLVFVLILTISLYGCSSMNTAAVKKVDKASVALIGVDKHISFSDDFALGSLVQKLAQDDKFDLQPMAKDLHNNVFGLYAESVPFNLMPEEQVIDTDRYKNFRLYDSDLKESNFKRGSNIITVENYKDYKVDYLDKSQREQLYKAIPNEADAMVLVGLSYKLVQENSMIPGVNKGKIKATLNYEVTNSSGERILNVNKSAKSDSDMKVVLNAGMLSPDKILPMCQEATDKVMGKMQSFIAKKL